MVFLFLLFKLQVLFLDLLCLLLQQQEQLLVVCDEVLVSQVLAPSGDLVIAPAVGTESVEFAQPVNESRVEVAAVMLLAAMSVQVVDGELAGRLTQALEV